MGPDSVKMAIRHEIQDRWILFESKWIYKNWWSLTCRKVVYDKVQRVDYDKIRSSVAMLIVYVDYSSNHYIFLLWDMLVGWQNTLLNRSMYTRYNQLLLSCLGCSWNLATPGWSWCPSPAAWRCCPPAASWWMDPWKPPPWKPGAGFGWAWFQPL